MKTNRQLLIGGDNITTLSDKSYVNTYKEDFVSKKFGDFFQNNLFNYLDLTEEIKKIDYLTINEKNILLETERENNVKYKKIYQVKKQIDEIFIRVFKGSENLQKRRLELFNDNEELWDKLYSENSNINIKYIKQFIKDSKILTKHEKSILLKHEFELEKIELILDEKYNEVEKISRNLNFKIQTIYNEIQKNYDKNIHIWNKLIINN